MIESIKRSSANIQNILNDVYQSTNSGSFQVRNADLNLGMINTLMDDFMKELMDRLIAFLSLARSWLLFLEDSKQPTIFMVKQYVAFFRSNFLEFHYFLLRYYQF